MTDPTSTPTDETDKAGGSLGAPIRILITEGQAFPCTTLAALLEAEPGVSVVGLAEDGACAATLAIEPRPDVVLMDTQMLGLTGIEATRRICVDPTLAATRVLILTVLKTNDYVLGAPRAGACGFLLKDTGPQSLVDTVRTVHEGQSLLSPQMLACLVTRMPGMTPTGTSRSTWTGEAEVLTLRQREAPLFIIRGLFNSKIEVELGITQATCHSHTAALLVRPGARDRAQLVTAAYEAGLISPCRGPLGRSGARSYLRA